MMVVVVVDVLFKVWSILPPCGFIKPKYLNLVTTSGSVKKDIGQKEMP